MYDSIVANLQRKHEHGRGPLGRTSSEHSVGSNGTASHGVAEKTDRSQLNQETYVLQPEETKTTQTSGPPGFLHLFPIHVVCNKAAVAIGNEYTTSVITAHCDKASGEFNAGHAGPFDIYRQLFNFEVIHPVIHIRPNDDYKAPVLATAAELKNDTEISEKKEYSEKKRKSSRVQKDTFLSKFKFLNRSVHSITTLHQSQGKKGTAPVHQSLPGQERWQGLSRYLDQSQQDDHDEWDHVEYARTTCIVDCPKLTLSFFWDVPGPVSLLSPLADNVYEHDINGGEPPGYGLDLYVHGGVINYGPWADRQRVIFQNFFFPASYVDAVSAERLKPGQSRVSTLFNIFVSVEDDTVLRIPMREPSKDWKWKGKAQNVAGISNDKDKTQTKGRKMSMWSRRRDKGLSGSNVRPFAWLDVKVVRDSTVSYVMDMFAREDGYHNSLDVDIRGTEISSSVNHGLLWRTGRLDMKCDLSNPLQWNALRTWQFNIGCGDLDIFILRDHLFLITDLVADWGSGPPPDYFTFTPFRYDMKIDLRNFKLFLNTNDSNIINNPADLEDNNYMILHGHSLHALLTIPLDQFKPAHNEIEFDVKGKELGLDLCVPPKNTLSTHLRSKKVAQLSDLSLTGSHTYFSETAPNLTDRLYMDVKGSKFTLLLYGFVIRHLMKIKDNYFGDDLHFKTLEEYQGLQHPTFAADKPEASSQHHNKSNDLDVILCVTATDACALLPANLYSSNTGIKIDVPFAYADLRFTSYYMDLIVNFSPIGLSIGSAPSKPSQLFESNGQTEMFITSVDIVGHRAFGLPPTEPTYVCNWDFSVGNISGEFSTEFLEQLASGGRAVGFSIDDDENALPVLQPLIIHDVTFLRLKTGAVSLWLHVNQEALQLSSDAITLSFNDLAGLKFSQRLQVLLPNLTIACVDGLSASRNRIHDGKRHKVKTHACLQTTLTLGMGRRKLDFTGERLKQQKHLRHEDQRTHRADFLFLDEAWQGSDDSENIDPPAMIFPPLPRPLASSFSFRSYSSAPSSKSRAASSGSSAVSSQWGSVRLRGGTPSTYSASSASIRRSLSKNQRNSNILKDSDNIHSASNDSRSPSAHRRSWMGRSETERRESGGLLSSSLALTSVLGQPYFPLQCVELDLSEFSDIPGYDESHVEPESQFVDPQDIGTNHLDENLAHTSFIVNAPSGIRVFITPKNLNTIVTLLDKFQPRSPETLLDSLQMSTMTEILDRQKRIDGNGKSTELSLKIPFLHVRFLNSTSSLATPSPPDVTDQYDASMKGFSFLMRAREAADRDSIQKALACHSTLGALDLSVRERITGGSADAVAITARIQDALVWGSQSNMASINFSAGLLEFAAASNKVHYLSALVDRTSILVADLNQQIATLNADWDLRLQLLTFELTKLGADTPDPQFLTRPSYALRAAADHLRSHDSWKIISQFRSIYRSLDQNKRKALLKACRRSPLSCPKNAKEDVFSAWDRWRTWDIAHVKESLIMRHIFGSTKDGIDDAAPPSTSLALSMRVGSTKVLIDPGPKRSEVSIDMLALKLALNPPQAPSGLMLVSTERQVTSVTLHASARAAAIQLSWEIHELIESALDVLEQNKERMKTTQPQTSSTAISLTDTSKNPEPFEFQAIIVTDQASFSIDSANIRMVSMTEDLQVSVVGNGHLEQDDQRFISVLLHSKCAGGAWHSRTRQLLRTEVERPTLSVSNSIKKQGPELMEEWRIAGASQKIFLDVTEQILDLIDVFDALLGYEIAYITGQIRKRSSKPEEPILEKASDNSSALLPNLTVALLMDSYEIRLAVIPPLTYSCTGQTGRLSVSPRFGKNRRLIVNYDLDRHEHMFYVGGQDNNTVISALELPLVNGQLSVVQSESKTHIDAYTTVELIVIEASALHGLVNTINRPEISSVFHAIQEDVVIVKSHIDEIFVPRVPSADRPNLTSSGTDLTYDVDITLAGLKVIARTPGFSTGSDAAILALLVGGTQIKAVNVDPREEITFAHPDITVQLRQMGVELTLNNQGTLQSCGNVDLGLVLTVRSEEKGRAQPKRIYRAHSSRTEVNIHAETASAIVDVINHLQDRLKDLDLSRERKYLQRLRRPRNKKTVPSIRSPASSDEEDDMLSSSILSTSTFALELEKIHISWIVGSSAPSYCNREVEDLVLSFRRIELSTRREDAARLKIEDMQLQMSPASENKSNRSLNSALLPEVILNVAYSSTKHDRKFAFQAASKSLDVRLESKFILPAKSLERSITLAMKKFRSASSEWQSTPSTSGGERKSPFGNKRLSSLVVDADFAGAVVQLQPSPSSSRGDFPSARARSGSGRYGQFASGGAATGTSLEAPGVAFKVEYKDNAKEASLNGELKIAPSTNTFHPNVVPLIIDVSNSVKEVVKDEDEEIEEQKPEASKAVQRLLDEDSLITADPSTILGRTRLNLGLRICKQEFGLSCQPIARVAATGRFEDVYVTISSVKTTEHGHFFAVSGAFEKLQLAVRHVYSRDSTFSFEIESIILSLLNSKHLSGTSGISAILKINPMCTQINARQLQDFLLFREIWIPPEIRQHVPTQAPTPTTEPSDYLVQRYHQVASAAAFPWNATVSMAEIKVGLDLGQAIGKSSLVISNVWASSKKDSSWEQNLCIGIDRVAINSSGRMSGFVELANVKVRTSIRWPVRSGSIRQTPLIQASIGFGGVKLKAAFDHQIFAITDIAGFEFLMYNVRGNAVDSKDRLVAVLDGDKIQVFCTATSASEGLALWQALERLVQENQAAYAQSLREIEEFLRRKSSLTASKLDTLQALPQRKQTEDDSKAPISLHTDVVVTLRSVQVGVFPNSVADSQIFGLEAADAQARFAASLQDGKVHSALGLTFGYFTVALASIHQPKSSTRTDAITIEEVIRDATSARGGIILRVPKVLATMETWQIAESNLIEYIFKSTFEGKVDVGWNYSRIAFIRNMWSNHSRTLAMRLGKPLPESAVKITAPTKDGNGDKSAGETEKITAVVNVPQSKYEYAALEPPIIETPQLRDMGEATPPLEWIGLHRDRLPNVTHQIVIVTLLEIAKEVEDAYERILGSS